MKRGRQRAHANWPRSSCGICICGKRKLVLPNFFCSWRKVGPPPSSRQYHSAKTITFVSQSSPPERRSCNGASRCEGSARTSRITDPISAVVMIPLIMMPRARLRERFSDAMAHHRWHDQNHNQSRQQPDRADNETARQRDINCAHRQKRKECLPPRFWFVDMLCRVTHYIGYSQDSSRRDPWHFDR